MEVVQSGHVECFLQLSHNELIRLVEHLKVATEKTRPSQESASASKQTSVAQPPQQLQQQRLHPQQQQQQQQQQRPPPQQQQQRPPPRPQPQSSRAPTPPQPTPPSQRATLWASTPQPASVSQPQGPQPARDWQVLWTTEPSDHDHGAITALTYAPDLKGLPGGDGHGGWLVSASDRMLNLWECSRARRMSDDAGLMLMHSQMIDSAAPAGMDAELASLKLLLATCGTSSAAQPEVAVHSLAAAEGGFLASQPANLLRPERPPGAPIFHGCSQVVALHSWGGPLTNTCAAAFDANILVFPLVRTGARAVAPKAEWRAHSAPVTALHRSGFSIRLFSGGADGVAHMWDLTGKPSAPAATFRHGSCAVTGVLHVRENLLAVAGADGNITLWDPRRSDSPLRVLSIGGGRITAMAASQAGDSLVVGTGAGPFHVDPSAAGARVECLPAPASWPVAALAWNSRTGVFYASSSKGDVRAFSRML